MANQYRNSKQNSRPLSNKKTARRNHPPGDFVCDLQKDQPLRAMKSFMKSIRSTTDSTSVEL